MSEVFIATADIHSPRYLSLFKASLRMLVKRGVDPCFIVIAGDLIDKGKTVMAGLVVKELAGAWRDKPLIAVFGNEEYHKVRPILKKMYSEVSWLEDEIAFVDCSGTRVGIIGTQGALQEPTSWQARNMPWLAREYETKPRIVAGLVREAKSMAHKSILVSHYGVARATLAGENPSIWRYLYSSSMEEVIAREKPDIVVHGHAHKGSPYGCVSGVPVYNVALPLNRGMVIVSLNSTC